MNVAGPGSCIRLSRRQKFVRELGANMITHVKFISIPTRDQRAALRFWTEQVGFKVMTDQPYSETARWIELTIANSDTRMVLFVPSEHDRTSGAFFYGALACDDIAATCRQLSERGVTITERPTSQPWGAYFKFKDPDGNEFVVSGR